MAARRRRRSARRLRAGVRRGVAQAVGVVAAVAAAAAGLGALAGVLSGGTWPWVILTYLRWLHVLISVLATVALVGVRWWRCALASAVVVTVLVASVVMPLRALRTVARPAGETLRIAVFNTGARNDDIAAIAGAIRSADPDVVVLLESEDIAERVDRRLDGLSALPAPDTVEGEIAPIVLARRVWPLTVEPLAAHLRPATVVTVDLDGQPVDVVAAHPLPPVTREWARSHDQSIAALTGRVVPRRRPYVLACDCNTTPWTPSMHRLLAVGLRAPTVAATFAAPVVGIPLDHVLLSPDVEAVSRRLGPFAGSDHRLIVTEVALRAATAPTRSGQ